MTADEMGPSVLGLAALSPSTPAPVLSIFIATPPGAAMLVFKPNPADEPRPLPLPSIVPPSVENEPGVQRINPATTESASMNRIADHLMEVAVSRIDPAAPPAARAAAKATFDEAKAARAAARVAEAQEQINAAARAYGRTVTEREGGRRR